MHATCNTISDTEPCYPGALGYIYNNKDQGNSNDSVFRARVKKWIPKSDYLVFNWDKNRYKNWTLLINPSIFVLELPHSCQCSIVLSLSEVRSKNQNYDQCDYAYRIMVI